MEYDDAAAAEFYENPQNRRPSGPPRRRARGPRLTEHFPIRFSASTIQRVRELAEEDGQTVGSWIRSLVDREVHHRRPRPPETQASFVKGWRIIETNMPAPEIQTQIEVQGDARLERV